VIVFPHSVCTDSEQGQEQHRMTIRKCFGSVMMSSFHSFLSFLVRGTSKERLIELTLRATGND